MYQVQVVLKKQICPLICPEDTCGDAIPFIYNLYFRISESSASSSSRFTEAKGHPVAIKKKLD
jgi:hypothetical protein